MDERYQNLITQMKDSQKQVTEFFKQLKRLKKDDCSTLFNNYHQEIEPQIDCRKCAHCCKTTSPRLNTTDIQRISKFLNIKKNLFIKNYLIEDEQKDMVLKSLPCPFLDTTDECSIYDVRPKDCKEYPHTDKEMTPLPLKLTKKNTTICPIVAAIILKLQKRM